jgi:hypothetical protein
LPASPGEDLGRAHAALTQVLRGVGHSGIASGVHLRRLTFDVILERVIAHPAAQDLGRGHLAPGLARLKRLVAERVGGGPERTRQVAESLRPDRTCP